MQQQTLLQVGPHIILVILGVAALVLAIDFDIVYVALPVLSPGATATPSLPNGLEKTGQKETMIAGLIAQTPLGRMNDADDIAGRSALPRLGCMTGSEFFVDGGVAQV
jgi:hypothetical protein